MRLHTKCVVRKYMMNINNRQQNDNKWSDFHRMSADTIEIVLEKKKLVRMMCSGVKFQPDSLEQRLESFPLRFA